MQVKRLELISLTKRWLRRTRKRKGKTSRVMEALVPWKMTVMRKIQI